MEFSLSEQQKMFRQSAREFAESEITPLIEQMEDEKRTPRELIPKMRELGFYAIQYPEEYGGVGATYLEYVMVLEELSRVYCSIGGHISVNNLCAGTLRDFGTEEQKQRYLPELLTGEAVGSFAFTEPDTGTDPRALRTTAVRDGDDWVINGEKIFITNSTLPGYIALFCKDVELEGKTTTILVPKDSPGSSTGRLGAKIGMHGMEVAAVLLENVRGPYENTVGGEAARGKGFKMLTTEREGVQADFPFSMRAVEVNGAMPLVSLDRVERELGSLDGRTLLLLGVSYRQDVGDTRYSPSDSMHQATRQL